MSRGRPLRFFPYQCQVEPRAGLTAPFGSSRPLLVHPADREATVGQEVDAQGLTRAWQVHECGAVLRPALDLNPPLQGPPIRPWGMAGRDPPVLALESQCAPEPALASDFFAVSQQRDIGILHRHGIDGARAFAVRRRPGHQVFGLTVFFLLQRQDFRRGDQFLAVEVAQDSCIAIVGVRLPEDAFDTSRRGRERGWQQAQEAEAQEQSRAKTADGGVVH